jgi:hypothetical protein
MARPTNKPPCRRLKIRGENWRIVIARPPKNDCRALCEYQTKTIWIRPSADNKIECIVHEILHACFYDLEEEAIDEAEQAIIQGLLVVPKIVKFKK